MTRHGSLLFLSPIFFAALALPGATHADTAHRASNRPLGLGVVLGEPSGLSAKYRINSSDGVDLGLAYGFNNFVDVFADYLYHFPGALGAPDAFVAAVTPYIGIGLRVFSNNGRDTSAGVGLRLPVGLEWKPNRPPLGIFVELVPGVGLAPSTFGFLEGGVGIRYYL